MSHIVESCPLTKLDGGLSQLHSADEDAVSWLTNYGKWHAYEKKKIDILWSVLQIIATVTVTSTHHCTLEGVIYRFSFNHLIIPAVLFGVLYRKASFRHSSSISELSEGSVDEITDDAGADSIMQPLYQLIFEVFELTGIFKWLPRTLVSLVQVTYGKSISRFVSESRVFCLFLCPYSNVIVFSTYVLLSP